ncbi:hypothetical protein J6590_053601 [Homalodisca vitripennis]|nr:hypothetical protein J6590_053601 [Homalodisca vitripennis]
MCHFNLGNLMDVQEQHITNHKFRDSGVQGQFDRSSLMWEMTVGVGGVCSLTSNVLVNLKKGVPPLPTLTGEAGSELASPSSGETRRPLLPNLEHPEYPVTPEAAQSIGGSDEVIHIHKESILGGNICSKIVFFGLLGALGVMVGLIIIEYHGTSDVDTQSAVDSPWSVMLEGWVDNSPAGHDDHEPGEHSSHEEEEHDEHDEHGNQSGKL